ncbi:MAG: ABC transporter ATP-binding protein/permease [Bacilli bacterium]|nr:ABC transporter ATP-binding protein/permease [Bacilli bacterium]
MLEIKKITKIYETDGFKQKALNKVSINFRKNEFASILGPSGSGKTTLLNIIGGLDRYDNGDLVINEVSTKEYKDSHWDSYRNHRVGFVFQSYNLITHQTILQNVELALTLSGVSKTERKRRAKKVLKSVGLENHINKLPNQLSGGQMQRVAIARALINDPDILLADEPTGALDSETSKQIMELLKEVAKEKLVIMVTHNPELAQEYSSRIIKLKDGAVIDDTDPYNGKENTKEKVEIEKKKSEKTSMNLKTALSLSLNNLLTKKGRTILTAFAGSIGIIGIALILSLSSGLNNYIEKVEEDTLSLYPLTLEKTTMDSSTFMTTLMESAKEKNNKKDKVYSNNIMTNMLSAMAQEQNINDLRSFKAYLESDKSNVNEFVSDIRYIYDLNINLYKSNYEESIVQVNPSTVFENLGLSSDMSSSFNMMGMSEVNSWLELSDKDDMLENQYEVVAGNMPEKYNEVVLVLDKNNQISDYALYSLGLLDQSELKNSLEKIMKGETIETKEVFEYEYDEIIGLTYKLILNTDYYQKTGGIWVDKREDMSYMKSILANAEDIKVVGIVRISEDSQVTTTGVIGYTKELTEYTINKINATEIAKEQLANQNINVFTGLEFSDNASFDINSLTVEQQQYLSSLSQEELTKVISEYTENASATYDSNLRKLGIVDLNDPYMIELYPKDFESKEEIVSIIDNYNKEKEESEQLVYTDIVGVMMDSVTTIINAISYILMAFVSISLIVSSIMIAIITYISVIERTKEIGILRAIGASKKDVSRVFNAETLIEGLFAGVLGIVVTLLLNIPINIIIYEITGLKGLSKLPWAGAIVLVIISVTLTFVAGLIPSRMASKKDPVIALRTE